MKKLIMAMLMASLCLQVKAQKDYCKDITRKVDEMKGEITFSTDYQVGSGIMFNKIITPTLTVISIDFYSNSSYSHYDSKGLFVKFEDGTILRLPELNVGCSYIGYSTYYMSSTLPLTDQNIDTFSTKKIVKFTIGTIDVNISKRFGEKLMAYAKCIYDAK